MGVFVNLRPDYSFFDIVRCYMQAHYGAIAQANPPD